MSQAAAVSPDLRSLPDKDSSFTDQKIRPASHSYTPAEEFLVLFDLKAATEIIQKQNSAFKAVSHKPVSPARGDALLLQKSKRKGISTISLSLFWVSLYCFDCLFAPATAAAAAAALSAA